MICNKSIDNHIFKEQFKSFKSEYTRANKTKINQTSMVKQSAQDEGKVKEEQTKRKN